MSFVLFNPDFGWSEDLTASTSMTIMAISDWKAPERGDSPISFFPITSTITDVTITETRLSWKWRDGLEGLIWAFYSEDDNRSWKAWGWDYVTPNHTLKVLKGYPAGWVGTAVGTCAACKGHKARTNVFFTESYH